MTTITQEQLKIITDTAVSRIRAFNHGACDPEVPDAIRAGLSGAGITIEVPKAEEFEGYLIAPHAFTSGECTGVWELTDRKQAERGGGGIVSASSADNAYHRIAVYAEGDYSGRDYIAPLLALAHWFEKQ